MASRLLLVLAFIIGLVFGYFARELVLLRAEQENAALDAKIEQAESEIRKIQSELNEAEIEASTEISEESFTDNDN